MITHVKVENYKAFQRARIDMSPIILLVGANSVGKSSILQLFLLLYQTALTDSNYKAPLKLNGGFVNLGMGINLVRGKVIGRDMKFTIGIKSNNLIEQVAYLYDNVVRSVFSHSHYIETSTDTRSKSKPRARIALRGTAFSKVYEESRLRNKLSKKDRLDSIATFKTFLNKIRNDIQHSSFIQRQFKERLPGFVPDGLSFAIFREYHADYEKFVDLMSFLVSELDDIAEVSWSFASGSDEHLKLNYLEIGNVEKVLLKIGFEEDSSVWVSCSNLELSKALITAVEGAKVLFTRNSTIFHLCADLDEDAENYIINRRITTLGFLFNQLISHVLEAFRGQLADYGVHYVSPLRAHPRRYYFLDKARVTTSLDTLDGDAITEVLKENAIVRESVNLWLDKFGLMIRVGQLKDVIHRIMINQNNLNLDITDVGFGISQILPVIIQGFLSGRGSLTIVEQPEIHLHPKMQAELADLLIDIAGLRGETGTLKHLLVETHSEYLLRRLRRRVAEGAVSSSSIRLYAVNPGSAQNGSEVREIEVHNNGYFEWPKEFRDDDLVLDTLEYLKNIGRRG